MSQRPRIVIAQKQRLALNASLHGAIRILRHDTAGLTRYLEEQAAENPHLRLTAPEPPALGDWLPRWTGSLAFGNRRGPPQDGRAADGISAAPSLIAHVSDAIRAMALPRSAHKIALVLVEALEPSGWLGRSLAEIADECATTEAEVLAVLRRLQGIEPAGLFARSLAECLRLQAEDRGECDAVMARVLDHLDLLAAGDIARLARLCATGEAAIQACFRRIRAMNPKPGAEFALNGGFSGAAALREPDLIARPLKDGHWQVSLNRSALPALDVVTAPEDGSAAPDALGAARALAHMLRARNETLLQVGREIVARQIPALVQGPGALRPMTMAEVAEAMGLHVSTISRVVAGASLDSPQGVWWLRRMFSGGRSGQATGPDDPASPTLAAAALRHLLTRLIAEEPAGAPLSDAALSDRLAQETGVRLARRTVAQYRQAANIPPAHRRKRPRL